jgi:phosphoserine aminotransferase
MLRAYDSSGNEIYSYALDSEQLTGPVVFSLGPSERRTAVIDNGRQMIHLVGKNGGSIAGFPHRAGPWYNIGRVVNKSSWNLLVSENDAFLYNYELTSGSK